jgi:hypothetical protein
MIAAGQDHGFYWPFATIAPLIYFGPLLRSIEASAIDVYETIEAWILPIRIWFVG